MAEPEDYKTLTIASYDSNTKNFSEKFKTLTDTTRRKEFTTFTTLLKGTKILDLGCGAGDHASYFTSQGLDVTCVDLSQQMITLCKEKGLTAYQMDIENLSFKEKTFDGIWAVTSLLHIPKTHLPQVITSLHSLLQDEGIVFVCVKKGEGEHMIMDKNNKTKRFFSFWNKKELVTLFEEQFDYITGEEITFNATTFLQLFFRKK